MTLLTRNFDATATSGTGMRWGIRSSSMTGMRAAAASPRSSISAQREGAVSPRKVTCFINDPLAKLYTSGAELRYVEAAILISTVLSITNAYEKFLWTSSESMLNFDLILPHSAESHGILGDSIILVKGWSLKYEAICTGYSCASGTGRHS